MNESTLPNEALQSQLSAFVDGELPTAETELLARRLAREPELQQAMNRYVLMGEALRAPAHGRGVSRDFSARIAAAIEASDNKSTVPAVTPATHKQTMPLTWLRPVAGVAVAASVALAAVLVVRQPQQAATAFAQQAAPATVQLASSAANGESYVVPTVANAPSAPIPAARLTNYVVAHSEFTSPLGQRNMLMGLLSGDDAETNSAATVAAAKHGAENEINNSTGQ